MDVDILKSINASGQFSGYWKTTTNSIFKVSAAVPLGIMVAGGLTGDKDLMKKGLYIGETVVVNALVTELLKRAATRDRPSTTWDGVIKAYKPGNDGKSLPSGHTSAAFSLAMSTSLEFKKWYITVPCFAYATSIGYSRMYLGAHYPSDVLAGAVVGSGTAILMHWANHKLFNRKKPELKPVVF
jgi:undecaprenyl-diphosphatase